MKFVIFTGDSLRHKFVANELFRHADDALIISERKGATIANLDNKKEPPLVEEHFRLRDEIEKIFFGNNEEFAARTIPIAYKEANSPAIFEAVKNFQPDMMFVFGSSIVREPLLSFLPPGRFINMHLGLSPYYRGAGTNFWPFVNKEPGYVGATILHINTGVDAGDIIAHARPEIEIGDNVHTIGCKTIKAGAAYLKKTMDAIREGKELNRVRQWKVPDEKYYKVSDFNEAALLKYKQNLAAGLIEKYIMEPKKEIKLIYG